MGELLPLLAVVAASLFLVFLLLSRLARTHGPTAILWHTVLEERMTNLARGGGSRERRILDFVLRNGVRGDPQSVVAAIDKYCGEQEWAMNVGDEKGAILDKVLEEASASTVLELGTYCGYSAVRMARVLKPGARLLTIEFNPDNANVANQVFQFAGVQDKVSLLEGSTEDIIPQLKKKHDVDTLDFVFLDHWKDRYVPDTKLLEECGLLRAGTVLLADNVISPGAPEFLRYVRGNPHYDCTHYPSHLEYSEVEDGLEKAVYKS